MFAQRLNNLRLANVSMNGSSAQGLTKSQGDAKKAVDSSGGAQLIVE
jgi:hypothetical protein